MTSWSSAGDRHTPPVWGKALQRWNAVSWLLYGLFTAAVVVLDPPGEDKTWSLVLLGVLAACYAVVMRYPGNRVLRPYTYLWVLVLSLSGLSYLRDGYAALFMVTLPHFWVLARSWRESVGFSALGAVGTLAGSMLRVGWSADFFSSNVISTLIVYSASVLIGTWVHQVLEESRERARLIGELERAQAQLSQAHQRQGAADERERMAREIHDTLAQGFASIVVLAEAARSGLDSAPYRSEQQLRSIEATARENLAEARELVGSAREPGWPAVGTVARTLRRTLDRFTEDTGLAVVAELADVDCDQQTRIALLRCTQESLANVRKHARASTVGVVLARHAAEVELEITDDGVGFDVGRPPGFGLDGMRKRLAELGGELTVTSSPGDGTRVLAMIPLESEVPV
ncbi:sensor histidine kinase [Nonomuraea spiralis]|uniref:histidine kinase n=1 Tax=Nonomuraea spiralis TaxID=46182 RepID=A0ABV5IZH0_9ACTN|nr:sensor histidine kinase [Nonomuraea spiralis]GGT19140.1 two-component sensor histidine kinase [Nonomuraea spiralis]